AVAVSAFIVVLLAVAIIVRSSGFDEGTIGTARLSLLAAALLLVAGALALAFAKRPARAEIARYVEEVDPGLDGALVTAADPRTADTAPALAARLGRDAAARAELAKGRRKEDVKADLVSAGTLSCAVALLAGMLAGGPPELRRAMSLLLAVPGSEQASALPFIQVEPGNINLPVHADLAVVATTGNFDASDAMLIVLRGGWETGLEERVGMAQDSDGRWTARRFDLDTLTDYHVEAGGIRSARFRITVSALPYVSQLDLAYTYPAYTGLAPDTVANGGDIAAVAGTSVQLSVETTIPAQAGRIVVEGADTVSLAVPDSGDRLVGSMTVRAPGFYR